MISYIRGELAAVQEQKAIVEAGGIGYGIYMSQQTLSMLPAVGEEVKIHTYLNVREDAMQLYGFLTGEDLQVFRLLIGVSGIGPKAGLNILSCLSPDELRFAVLAGDVKTISSAPGIGKKTAAERGESGRAAVLRAKRVPPRGVRLARRFRGQNFARARFFMEGDGNRTRLAARIGGRAGRTLQPRRLFRSSVRRQSRARTATFGQQLVSSRAHRIL